jgi:hypothetical protein
MPRGSSGGSVVIPSTDHRRVELHRIAGAFRAGLAAARWPNYMPAFPRACCGTACDLLGLYLLDHGQGTARYVWGEKTVQQTDEEYPQSQSHAWLVLNGFIIDITADQFDEGQESVIVCRDSAWHRNWTVRSKRPVGWRPDNEFSTVYAFAMKSAVKELAQGAG